MKEKDNNTKDVVKIETSYPQKVFIKDKLRPIFILMNNSKRKVSVPFNDIIRENGEYKNFIGVDTSYKKGKAKSLTISLFWGKYEKLNTEEDYYELIDSCKNEHKIQLKKDFDYDKNVNLILDFFKNKLSTL